MADKHQRGHYPNGGSPPPQTVKGNNGQRPLAEVAVALQAKKDRRKGQVVVQCHHMAAADFAARFRRAGDVPVAVDEDN